jgi:HD-like signal output (HDOD) protein
VIDGPALAEVITLGKIRVPPAPAAALRIRRRLGDAGATPDELAQIASVDPALSAAVLGLANSGSFQPLAAVSSVQEAVERIGPDELARVALAIDAGGAAARPGPLGPLRLLAWRRSLTCAFLCRFVAEGRGYPSDDAFACGLLHDFGWIVALTTVEDLLAQNPGEERRPASAWMSLVDQFHILLGHIAATRWNLSPLIADVILCHHDPAQAPEGHRPMVELVAACDRLVTLLEDQPAVSAADIACIPGFEAPLAARLAEALPRIAAATGRLLELAPVPPPTAPAPPSKVSRPPQILRGKIKDVRWDVAWIGPAGPVAGQITSVSADGVVALFPQAPRENYIVKLAIAGGGGIVELFVTPLLVEPEGPQQRMEGRLFALAGEPKVTWDQMYRRAAG